MLLRFSLLLLVCLTISSVTAQKGGRKASASSPANRYLRGKTAAASDDQFRQVQEPDREGAGAEADSDSVGGEVTGGHPAPEPYSFSYAVDDAETGASNYREESQDANGEVVGYYHIKDADGRMRRVDYTAGKDGFKAKISSNEEGIIARSPADVEVIVSASQGINRYQQQKQIVSESAQSLKGLPLASSGQKFFQKLVPTTQPTIFFQQQQQQQQQQQEEHNEDSQQQITQQQQQQEEIDEPEPTPIPSKPIQQEIKGQKPPPPGARPPTKGLLLPSAPVFTPVKTIQREPQFRRVQIQLPKPQPRFQPTSTSFFRQERPKINLQPVKAPQEQLEIVQKPIVQEPIVQERLPLETPQQTFVQQPLTFVEQPRKQIVQQREERPLNVYVAQVEERQPQRPFVQQIEQKPFQFQFQQQHLQPQPLQPLPLPRPRPLLRKVIRRPVQPLPLPLPLPALPVQRLEQRPIQQQEEEHQEQQQISQQQEEQQQEIITQTTEAPQQEIVQQEQHEEQHQEQQIIQQEEKGQKRPPLPRRPLPVFEPQQQVKEIVRRPLSPLPQPKGRPLRPLPAYEPQRIEPLPQQVVLIERPAKLVPLTPPPPQFEAQQQQESFEETKGGSSTLKEDCNCKDQLPRPQQQLPTKSFQPLPLPAQAKGFPQQRPQLFQAQPQQAQFLAREQIPRQRPIPFEIQRQFQDNQFQGLNNNFQSQELNLGDFSRPQFGARNSAPQEDEVYTGDYSEKVEKKVNAQ